ncbi:ParA family protein [Clostridium sp. 19966]|uniref:ParA family protein n=1 Tax=Clostridium sp. 19966 TaxID=2768166 RepID=UPI0028DF2F62|nr:ParA family protein [Clostridium sp. 19966]MDT8716053.1 ParA family protein [Clostridium sp. 19966]
MKNNQIIAVWGNPSSGKTTGAIRIAKEISLKKKNVIVVFCDIFSPMIMTLLPSVKGEEKSLGSILSAPEINQETILSKCITLDKNKYISLLGYTQGENIFTYAEYSKERAVDFLILLRHLADYVVIDCSSVFAYDILSAVSLEMADSVVRFCSSNLKAVSYFNSYLPLLADRKFNLDKHIKVLSNMKVNEPVEQIKELYKGISYEFPFVEELENKFLSRELFNDLNSKDSQEYKEAIRRLASFLMGETSEKISREKAPIVRKAKMNEEKSSLFKKVIAYGKGGAK